MLGDHLGSTSITANSSGGFASELRYKPWGETRYTNGTTPTRRQYTGQINDSEMGLYFYGARFYAPYLNRWLSPDTIVPDPANPQSLNRYSYVLGNPLRYTDPTGHRSCDDGPNNCESMRLDDPYANPFGIRFIGRWVANDVDTMIHAADVVARALTSLLQREDWFQFKTEGSAHHRFSAVAVFKQVYGSVALVRAGSGSGAETFGNRNGKVNTIEFYDGAFSKGLSLLNNAIHEFGHLFAHHVGYTKQGVQIPYNDLINTIIRDNTEAQIAGGWTRTNDGYPSIGLPGQQHAGKAGGEDFSDMFLNWSLNSFAQDAAGAGAARYGWVNSNMPRWIALAVNGNN